MSARAQKIEPNYSEALCMATLVGDARFVEACAEGVNGLTEGFSPKQKNPFAGIMALRCFL